MTAPLRHLLLALPVWLMNCAPLLAQLPGVAPPAQAAPPQVQAVQQPGVPPEFQLTPAEQAYLDQVLSTWEQRSAKVATFRCPFERWEYIAAFGPGQNLPLNKDKGEVSYQKPDKGSFQIDEIRTWQATPIPPGQQPPAQAQGDWVVQPNAIGEHWVCDGQNIYEFRHDQKQMVERPIPKELQGKAIVDGPLPFLFGAEAAKLKQRYWMKIEPQQEKSQIWLQAMPKYQADAANYRAVRLILDQQQMLPVAMEVIQPNGDRHAYMFKLAEASVNNPIEKLTDLFKLTKPIGWQRVVEQPQEQPPAAPIAPPQRQAAQANETQR